MGLFSKMFQPKIESAPKSPVPNESAEQVHHSLDLAKEHFSNVIGNYPETSDEATVRLHEEFGTIDRNKIDDMLANKDNQELIRKYGTLNPKKIEAIESAKDHSIAPSPDQSMAA